MWLYRPLIIAALCLGPALQAQDVDIEIVTPTSTSICGPEDSFNITFTNNSELDATDLVAEIGFPNAALITSASAPATLDGTEISFGDLAMGESVTITITFQTNCGFSANNFAFPVEIIEGGSGEEDSEPIQVLFADLSIPSSSPDVLPAVLGETATVEPRVVNNGFGEISELTYCVSDLDYLTLESITVGGIDITAGGPAFTQDGQVCFSIMADALMAAGVGPTFGQGESLFPIESWTPNDCPDRPESIRRRAQYGCQGDTDCQEKAQSDFIATGVSFSLVAPNIDAETVSRVQPACYVDEPTVVTMRLTNNGMAPAVNIRYRIFTQFGRGMAIDVDGITVVRESDNSPVTDVTVSNQVVATTCLAPGITDARFQVNNIDLPPGESLLVTYELVTNCGCNDCDIRNKYYSIFQLEGYDDRCLKDLRDQQRIQPTNRFDAYIQGFPEGPLSLFDDNEGCVTYFVTEMQLDWLTGAYPNSALTANFALPCGLDFVPSTFEWTDRDGMSYPAASVDYVDNGNGADDELVVTFLPGDRPSGFNYAGGAQFDFCVEVDCTEKPMPACGDNIFDVDIASQFDFTTDPSCPSACATQKIWAPDDLTIRLVCPAPAGCDCDGITFTDLDIERTSFGLPDDNNDQIPGGTISAEDLETDRFLTGDTIKVTLQAIINDVDDSQDFDYGFVTYPLVHSNFNPLSATVSIFDASNGNAEFQCTAVPIRPDYPNTRIIVDFSRDALNNFGCGLPADFLYEDGDSISVCFSYSEKDIINTDFRVTTYEPRFYVSEEPFEMGLEYQCTPLIGRLTQIGISTGFSNATRDFGACDLPNWSIRYNRFIGGAVIDEFPNEIRSLGLPDRLVFNKPSEFIFSLENWDIRLRQRINPANDIVNTTRAGQSIPPEFFVVSGDQVTLLIGDYLRSLGNSEIPPDEGYEVTIFPKIQGNCESLEGNYDYSYQFFESVEPSIFCTDEIANPMRDYTFEYLGAARLSVIPERDEIRLCSGNDVAVIRVRNLEVPTATNAFLYPEPTGGILVNRIEDAGSGAVIPPNEFGIYELGNIGRTSERRLRVFFTKNTCGREQLDFVAGWDCLGYPTTINDAICTDPSTINITSARSNVDMVVREPTPGMALVIPLCDPVPYEVDILSTDLGYVRDIVLNFRLPSQQFYIPGSMMLSVPSPALGGTFVSVEDPVLQDNGFFSLDVSSLDPLLNTEGLVGSKDPENSVITVRFAAQTECGYLSRSTTPFLLTSRNSCGNRLRRIGRRSGRVRVRDSEPSLDVEVSGTDFRLNACNMDTTTMSVLINTESMVTTNLDSIRILLPSGIGYVPDTYVPGVNAAPGMNPAFIRDLGTQTALVWSLNAGLPPGSDIAFDLDINAFDVGQFCGDNDIVVQAYTSFEAECMGMICSAGEISGEAIQPVTIEKADFDFNFVDGSITLNPADGTASADFSAKLTNFGFGLDPGTTVALDIYEDVNTNGVFDDEIDEFLFRMDSTLVEPLLPGGMVIINEMATFPASNICTIIGVVSPDETCTCSELASETFRPEIIFDYETDFDVCSGEQVQIGPDPVAGYNFNWLSVDGSDLGNLSPTDATPTTFTAPANNSGSPIMIPYTLRTSNAPCFDDQIVTVTIAPDVMEMVNVNACMDAPYSLPTVNDPNASNFSWEPAAELTTSDDGRIATVNNISADQTYTLTYEIGDGGCEATFTVNLTAVNCGGSNTALGDTVFFDLNEDGLQTPGEPGIEGVTVNLIDANTGAVIATTQTGPDGSYIFEMLPASNYAVEFIPLPGFVFTNDTGGDDLLDSDADPETGITPSIFLALDEQDLTFDAGFIPDCTLEAELIVSECIPSGDTLARQVQIMLTWDGNPYTYDQFGDGNDTIDVTFAGMTFPVVISELSGDTIALDTILRPLGEVSYTVDAVFRQSTTCTATTSAGPFTPCIVDLALTKSASTVMPTPGPYAYGDLICMDITVTNQGALPVDNVQVFDSLPVGFDFNEEFSPDWTDVDPLALFIFPDPIAAGAAATATICVNLQMSSGGPDDFTNVAEINSFTDLDGNDLSDFDEDSTPDLDFGNDAGGSPDSPSDDSIDGDGTGAPGDMDATTDEDDSDPFAIDVFDLALVKMLETEMFFAVGDTVTYSFEVYNQGNVAATNVRVVDYIPEGFKFLSQNSPPWGPLGTLNSTTDTTSALIPGPIAPGDTVTLAIDLKVVFTPGVFNRVNTGEILEAAGPDGEPVTDIDSTPDDDPENDAGGAPMSDADDATDGNGTGTPGATDAATDEDDADPSLMAIDSVSIGSTVFIDPNDNGIQDGDESGVADVIMELFIDADGDMMISASEMTPIATTTTDVDGNYYFGMLPPGNYQVQVAQANFESGNALADFGTSSGATGVADDDVDGNDDGDQPSGPFTAAVSSVVRLLPTLEPEIDTETFPGGSLDTDNGQIDANGNMTVDFGFTPNVSVGSTVFADYNDNAVQDTDEPGIPMVVLYLYVDADNDGFITGAELTPVDTTETDGMGNYLFDGLAPGNYRVGIPPAEFGTGGGLEFLPMSSTDISTTNADNEVDGDDNGLQDGGPGTIVFSPVIALMPGTEPLDSDTETEQGNEGDLDADAAGDMTVDFGFVCNLEIVTEDGPFTICSTKALDIAALATITPGNVDGTWVSSGDGTFLNDAMEPVDPARYSEVTFYMPGPGDVRAGTVSLTLTTDPAGVCPPVSATLQVEVLKVDCGGFFWDGGE